MQNIVDELEKAEAALAELREWLLQDGELATITVAAVVAYMDALAAKEPTP